MPSRTSRADACAASRSSAWCGAPSATATCRTRSPAGGSATRCTRCSPTSRSGSGPARSRSTSSAAARAAPRAQRLVGLGVLSALPAIATGATDWSDTTGRGAPGRLVHAALNTAALACFAASWARPPARPHGQGVMWGFAGSAVATGGGYLGGHLTQRIGLGIDTHRLRRARRRRWTATLPTDGVGRRRRPGASSPAAPRSWSCASAGVWHGLDSRCSHRGGPLDEGTVRNGCMRVPVARQPLPARRRLGRPGPGRRAAARRRGAGPRGCRRGRSRIGLTPAQSGAHHSARPWGQRDGWRWCGRPHPRPSIAGGVRGLRWIGPEQQSPADHRQARGRRDAPRRTSPTSRR